MVRIFFLKMLQHPKIREKGSHTISSISCTAFRKEKIFALFVKRTDQIFYPLGLDNQFDTFLVTQRKSVGRVKIFDT